MNKASAGSPASTGSGAREPWEPGSGAELPFINDPLAWWLL